MNPRLWIALILVSTGWLCWAGRADAQTPFGRPPTGGSSGRPAVSPYLNLSRTGNAAINYYGLVRPQQDTRSAIQQLYQQERDGSYQIGVLGQPQEKAQPGLPFTGHSVRFASYQKYFFNLGSGQAVAAPATARPATLLPPTGTGSAGLGRPVSGGASPFSGLFFRN